MTYFCEKLKELDVPLEFNLLGFSDKRNYPNSLFWEIVSEVGNKVIIGFDAHNPTALENLNTYNNALEYLNKLNITPIDTMNFKK